MTMLGPNPKEGPPGMEELVEVLEEPLAPSDDLIFSHNNYSYYYYSNDTVNIMYRCTYQTGVQRTKQK